jgi:hypothetical protein
VSPAAPPAAPVARWVIPPDADAEFVACRGEVLDGSPNQRSGNRPASRYSYSTVLFFALNISHRQTLEAENIQTTEDTEYTEEIFWYRSL